MKNLKIGMKLIVGFGLVLLMMAAIIISGITSLLSTNEQILSYAERTLPATNDVWQMRRDLVSIQRYMLMALADNDTEKIKENMNLIATESERLATTLESASGYQVIETSQVTAIKGYFAELAPIRKEIQTLLIEATTAANAKAYQIFEDTYKPGVDKIGTIMEQIGVDQTAMAAQQKNMAEVAFLQSLLLIIVIAVIAVLTTIFIVILISKGIKKPVNEIEKAMDALAKGDFDNSVVTYESKDELGILATDIRKTIERISFIIKDLTYGLTEISNGNFNTISKDNSSYVGQYKKLSDATYKIIFKLSETLAQINQAAEEVSSGSDQVSSGAQALSQGATEQASSIEELAASIADVSSQVKENAENANKASEMSRNATNAISASNEQMQHLMQSMHDIDSKSKEIGKIIKTIEDIAFQTNILALNAAVEAARAGTAGKGFAVVADEVRNLASKSADAAQNTTTLIEDSIKAINIGVHLANSTADNLLKVVEGANETSSTIMEITRATNDQAQSISQVTIGLDQISSVVQTNSATAEESAAASEELSGQAQMLRQLISAFQLTDLEKDNQAKDVISIPTKKHNNRSTSTFTAESKY